MLTRDVERQIFGVNDTLDEVEVLGNELLAVVHNEHTANVELNVVELLLGFEHVEGSATRGEQHGTEFKLSLDAKVLHSEIIFPVIGESLVENRHLAARSGGGSAVDGY